MTGTFCFKIHAELLDHLKIKISNRQFQSMQMTSSHSRPIPHSRPNCADHNLLSEQIDSCSENALIPKYQTKPMIVDVMAWIGSIIIYLLRHMCPNIL